MCTYNKNLSEGMRIIIVFQKHCCDYRKTSKYHARRDEHSGDDSDEEVK